VTGAPLPEGFEDLAPFAEAWAVHGSDARKRRRIASTEDERQAFYEAALPRVPAALAYLDAFDVDALDGPQKRLMDLMLTFAHVSLAVEAQGPDEAYHALSHAHFIITRGAEDQV
jgi:hypothetical protein